MIVNKKQLADIFGLSERTFTEYQRDPSFPYRAAGRGHDNEYDTTAVHSWLLERATTKGRESSREKLDRVRAGREELAYAAELKELIDNHRKFTGSTVAKAILDNWENELELFKKVMPVDYKRALLELAAEEAEAAASV